ncbi:MAG: hypothetical protein C4K47_03920 [Candidatus Thorarchaeota archaeon]|nr:MAG: hypothetical protein C4K47_03920 [Candidatus Thorarchaeota archaeon]
MEKNMVLAIVVVVIVVGAAGAYILLQPPAVTLIPPRIHTIIQETAGDAEYLDPAVDYETAGGAVIMNVYETLYGYEWVGTNTTPSVPLLATSYVVSGDGKNYTFTLRQGVTFHDGTPFNATAMKYSLDRVMKIFDTAGPAWMFAEPLLGGQAVEDAANEFGAPSTEFNAAYDNWFANSHSIIVLDTYTIRLRLAFKYAPFFSVLAFSVACAVSPTWVEANGGVEYGTHNAYVDTHTCGTGPYMMTSWVPTEQIQLTAYTNYWRATAAKAEFPNAGSITNVVIKQNTDVNSRILNLLANSTDTGYWPTTHALYIWNRVNGSNGDGTLKSLYPQLKLWCQVPTYDVMFMGFNMREYMNISNNIVKSPFVIKEVREAFSYAFDYATMIANVLNGFGQQAQGPIPIGMFGHNDSLRMYSYDLDKAVEKWNAAMSSGLLEPILANMSYNLDIYYNEGNTVRQQGCLLMGDGIQAILDDPLALQPVSPLTVTVKSVAWPSYLYMLNNRQLGFFFLGWAPDYADPDDYVVPFVKSTGLYANRIGLQLSTGWNATLVDGWITAAAQELDPTARNVLYGKIQQAVVDQAAFVWAYQAQTFHVEGVYMNGYNYNPMWYGLYFYHFYKAYPTGYTMP